MSKQEMDQALESGTPASSVAAAVAGRNDQHARRPTPNEVPVSSHGLACEAAHITAFNASDPRKRGRSYLGFTFSKPMFAT